MENVTAREEANKLIREHLSIISKYSILYIEKDMNIEKAKQCALVSINSTIELFEKLAMNEGSLTHKYLLAIKTEIENY